MVLHVRVLKLDIQKRSLYNSLTVPELKIVDTHIYHCKFKTTVKTVCKYPCPTSAQCWSVKIDKFQDSAGIEVKLWNKIPRIFLRKLSKEFSANCYLISYKRRVTIFKSPWLLKKSRYRDTLAKGFNVCFFFLCYHLRVSDSLS